ncbi:transcriptional regulator [Sinomicrobium soli]|nr:transcriptional regulator [Sinomicrobium sp. N-1-3-6]
MKTLKYTVIKNREQYDTYCNILEGLLRSNDEKAEEEIELLTLLIEKWDKEHNTLEDQDPITLLKSMMAEHQMKAKDLEPVLELSKGTISKILNYHKGLSKDTIRKLSEYFMVSQEAFNRPYKLINAVNRHFRNASLMNTRKNIAEAG